MNDAEIRTLLGGVLLTGENVFKPVGVISGGEKTKLSFAIMMLRRGNVLILDEPTNHLDSATCEVLEDALVEFDGTMILVSHDRYLLNKVVTRIIEVTPNGVKSYEGNFDSYIAAKELEAEAAPKPAEAVKKEPKKQYRTREQRAADAKRKQEHRDAEERIDALEAEIKEIDASLADPAIGGDYQKVAELCERLEEAKREVEEMMEVWLRGE